MPPLNCSPCEHERKPHVHERNHASIKKLSPNPSESEQDLCPHLAAVHSRDQGNDKCDQLAKTGVDKPLLDTLDLDIPITFDLQGAKLAALTQANTYCVIMEHQPQPTRPTTSRNLQATREAIQNYNGLLETDATIWAGMKRCTL